MTIGLGIIGFGFIGRVHARAFAADPRARLVAIADEDEQCLQRATAGNLPDPAGLEHVGAARQHASLDQLLRDDEVEAVVVAVPTPLHASMVATVLAAGRHVLVEKPLAVHPAEANAAVLAAERHADLVCLPGHCMRHWPGWRWLKDAIRDGRYGAPLGLTIERVGFVPDWGQPFYGTPSLSGSAILDLHVHDADFVRFCLGDPTSVSSVGWQGAAGGIDHVVTEYRFGETGPPIAVAEGGWLPGRYPFHMQYRACFERAVAEYRSGDRPPLTLYADGREPEPIEGSEGDGYAPQASHFLDCVESGGPSEIVSIRDGAAAVRLIEAERRSVETGGPVPIESVGAASAGS